MGLAFFRRRFGGFSQNENGASAVEFALVLPVFLLIIIGILCYGFYYATVHSVQNLTAEAARASVAGITPDERSSIARAFVDNAVPNYSLIDASKVTLTVGPNVANPDMFDVRLNYDSSSLPIWMFEDFLPLPPKVINRVSIVRRGGF